MTSRHHNGLSIVGFLVLATWLVLGQQRDATARPGADQVLVTNPASQPVPVILQGAVSADVSVSNLPAVQQVAGSISVANLPEVQQIAGAVTVAQPALRRGHQTIRLSSEIAQRMMTIPADVVVTDLRLERIAFPGDDESCEVWLFENNAGTFGPVTTLRPSATNPFVELHLESGFGPQPGVTERGVFMNAACSVRVFWSGYTAE